MPSHQYPQEPAAHTPRHDLRNRVTTAMLCTVLSACTTMAPATDAPAPAPNNCPGKTTAPAHLQAYLAPVDDQALLQQALGAPNEGGLCSGQVYEVRAGHNISVYRAWNSTSDASRLGRWWALDKPAGKISVYETQFDICYQWSPLDKLSHCTLVPGARIVIGPGQSMQCPQGLILPASSTQQVFIATATSAVKHCEDFDGVFHWVPSEQ